ncbi:hypothetical protein LEP3755_48250 [Leptolyngbya sp. NIES-3755]|nr:hypothetical protein LEP3755_48250 [Leptolyngbya sp. NIES-3755]
MPKGFGRKEKTLTPEQLHKKELRDWQKSYTAQLHGEDAETCLYWFAADEQHRSHMELSAKITLLSREGKPTKSLLRKWKAMTVKLFPDVDPEAQIDSAQKTVWLSP